MNFIKTTLLTVLLSVSTTYCMEEQNRELQPQVLEDLGLPNEMWAQILEHVYFDSSILNEAHDIYEGIAAVNKYILKYFKTILLVCKTFKDLNTSKDQWMKLKKELKEFYIPHLNEKFLEQHQSQVGLFPKNGTWHENTTISNNIATFLALGIMPNNTMVDVVDPSSTPHDHLKLITLLLFYGANADLQDNQNYTALSLATCGHDSANQNNIEIITILLQQGANPNLQDNDGATALYWAAFNHHSINKNNNEIITFLLQYDANPNLRYNDGTTALYWATRNHHLINKNNNEITTLLLQHGANPNLQDNDGETALYWATRNHHLINSNNIEITTLLLQHGANPNLQDNDGKTAFDFAKDNNFNEFLELVRKYSKNTLTKICLQYILTNLPQFEGQLDTLPAELRDSIYNLKS